MDDLSHQNAKYIQLLNNNSITQERNTTLLEMKVRALEEAINNISRNAAAMQRAMVEFLQSKDIIVGEEDMKELQKLRLRNLARLDQEIARRQDH
jgi:uncharacterized protein YlxW (UPF0749 family)